MDGENLSFRDLVLVSPMQSKRLAPLIHFERTIVRTFLGEEIELIDGGYCANNPTLYAIADAIKAYNIDRHNVRVVNIGVGNYPEPKPRLLMHLAKSTWLVYNYCKKH